MEKHTLHDAAKYDGELFSNLIQQVAFRENRHRAAAAFQIASDVTPR